MLDADERANSAEDHTAVASATATITPTEWRLSEESASVRRVTTAAIIGLLLIAGATAGLLLYFQATSAPRAESLEAALATTRTRYVDMTGRAARLQALFDQAQEDVTTARERGSNGIAESETLANAAAALTDAQLAVENARSALTQVEIAAREAGHLVGGWSTRWLIYAGITSGVLLATTILLAYFRAEKRREWENRVALANLRSQEQLAQGDATGFNNLWALNQSRLQEYYTIVVNHAASIRQTTRLSIASGFVFLVAISAFSLLAEDVASAISSAVVASAGAVVTGFVARAVLRSSETSSRELLSFFLHPLHMERALAAERILRTMGDGASRDAARLELIRGLLQAPAISPGDQTPSESSTAAVP